jgi:signal transduction histidine kinase
MFTAVRIRLIGYVVGVLALVLLATGAFIYVSLSRQLNAAVDTTLRAASNRIEMAFGFGGVPSGDLPPAIARSDVPAVSVESGGSFRFVGSVGVPPQHGPALVTAGAPGPSITIDQIPPAPPGDCPTCTGQGIVTSTTVQGAIPIPDECPACPGVRSTVVGLPTAAVSQIPNSAADDAFALFIDNRGTPTTQYGRPPAGLPDQAAVAAAGAGREDLRTVELDGRRFRILTQAVIGPNGEPAMVTQSGISMADRDNQQRSVLLALTGGGLLGLALTVAGGLFLTSRAVAPVQLAFERQRRFVSDASHELRTPLTLLRAETESLARRLDAKREARPLLYQIDRISRLVRDLLTLTRLDERALPLEREPVPVLSLLRTAAAAAEQLAHRGVTIEVNAPADLYVDGDVDRLHQVLLILVDNACRVTPPNGRIGLTAEGDGKSVVIRVKDTGPGIPPEHLAHVFERFHRVDRARSRDEGGAGLGLAIARGIVDAHRGSISLSSRLGHGTTATLRLPAARP